MPVSPLDLVPSRERHYAVTFNMHLLFLAYLVLTHICWSGTVTFIRGKCIKMIFFFVLFHFLQMLTFDFNDQITFAMKSF